MSKTVEQWLAAENLPLELAKVLTPEPWKHQWNNYGRCVDCGGGNIFDLKKPCSAPNPITIDWNTAKYWQGKCDASKFYNALASISGINTNQSQYVCRWMLFKAQPKHYLIAAALSGERSKE